MSALTCENQDRACDSPADSCVMIDGITWHVCEVCAEQIGVAYLVSWCREVTR